MKIARTIYILNLMMLCLSLASCRRNTSDVWEDTKSASRHIGRGFRSLGGKNGDSRQVISRDAFYVSDDYDYYVPENEFVPLEDERFSNQMAMTENRAPQPRETPGEVGSSVPGIDSFSDPHTIPGLSNVFRNINFEYNSNLVKGENHLQTIRNVADYMKKKPNTYVFIEGHTDERGPEAYNLALGSRRSNAVRNLLISEGVNPNNIFTISYGKERPLVMDHHEESWAQNRRAEFKIYQR